MLRKDRVSPIKTRGGGVLFYIKEYINVVQRDDICSTLFPEIYFVLSKAMVRSFY